MDSLTLYRRWRPQTLVEVVGQEHITHTLRNALRSGRISHAYLFTGPRGTGKTSTGRILAKAVNCLNNEGRDEPCNHCSMCEAVTDGRAMDVIEIDAASNRGIDDIRELREKVGFAPNVARRKVYIIDEVHMLTTAASNALLKTLEEPPPYILFVLATTEPHQLLPTIVSRCQRHDFHRLSMAAVVKRLSQICQKEGFLMEEEVLRLIARHATGSLRDAENVLEQLISYYGNQVSLDQARLLLGATNESQVRELVEYITSSNITGGINAINSIAQEGTDLAQLHRGLVSYLRNLLLIRIGAEQSIEATKEEKQEMKKLAGAVSPDFLFRAMKAFSERDPKGDSYSPLPLELALLETCLAPEEEKRAKTPSSRPAQPKARPEPGAEQTAPRIIEQKVVSLSAQIPEAAGAPSSLSPSVRESPPTPSTELGEIQRRWREFVNSLRGMGSQGTLDALLRHSCSPDALENDVITLKFDNKFSKEKIADPKYGSLVEKGLQAFFRKPYKIACVLKSPDKTPARPQSNLIKAALEEMGATMIKKEGE